MTRGDPGGRLPWSHRGIDVELPSRIAQNNSVDHPSRNCRFKSSVVGFLAGRRLSLPLCLLAYVVSPQTALASFTQVTSTVVPGLDDGKVAWGDVNNDGWVDFAADGELYLNDPNNVGD